MTRVLLILALLSSTCQAGVTILPGKGSKPADPVEYVGNRIFAGIHEIQVTADQLAYGKPKNFEKLLIVADMDYAEMKLKPFGKSADAMVHAIAKDGSEHTAIFQVPVQGLWFHVTGKDIQSIDIRSLYGRLGSVNAMKISVVPEPKNLLGMILVAFTLFGMWAGRR